jgi:Bacterial membrane protein YfhO
LPGYYLVIHSGFWISLVVFWAAWMAMEPLEGILAPEAFPGKRFSWIASSGLVYGAAWLLARPFFPRAFWISLGLLAAVPAVRSGWARWGLLAAALGFSLGFPASSLNILLNRSYYDHPPLALERMTDPGRLFFTPPLLASSVRLQGASMAEAYEDAKQWVYPNWPLAYGREEVPVYNTLQSRELFAWTFDAFRLSKDYSRKVLDYLGIRYLFGKNEFRNFRKITAAGSPADIAENPHPMPKWFSVEKAVPAGISQEADFESAEKSGMDYSKECFIADPAKAGNYLPRKVEEEAPWPTRLFLDAQGKGRALLASSESYDPGWKAWAWDGSSRRKLAVEKVNDAFRGVVLRPGETRVEFLYEPAAFRLGLFISLVVCALWAFLGFREWTV